MGTADPVVRPLLSSQRIRRLVVLVGVRVGVVPLRPLLPARTLPRIRPSSATRPITQIKGRAWENKTQLPEIAFAQKFSGIRVCSPRPVLFSLSLPQLSPHVQP